MSSEIELEELPHIAIYERSIRLQMDEIITKFAEKNRRNDMIL